MPAVSGDAVKKFCETLQKEPDKVVYYTRGTSYQVLGDAEGALSDFWIAYQKAPDYLDTAQQIANICQEIGVAKLQRRAEQLEAKAREAWSSNIEEAQTAFETARKYFECILLAEPDNQNALRECGGLYYDAKEYKKALGHWKKLLELSPTKYHCSICAAAYAYMGDLDEKQRMEQLAQNCPE